MIYQTARRVVVFVVGMTVVSIGVVFIVTPGPAFIVIPAGLAILATEFLWARRLLNRMKEQARRVWPKNGRGEPVQPAEGGSEAIVDEKAADPGGTGTVNPPGDPRYSPGKSGG